MKGVSGFRSSPPDFRLHWHDARMGLLANLKLRRKLLIAMAPLAVMAILAGLYSSIQSKRIDTWYSQLINNGVQAVHHIDTARSLNRRFNLYLYRLIGETDADRRQVVD